MKSNTIDTVLEVRLRHEPGTLARLATAFAEHGGRLCELGALSTFGTWIGVEQHAQVVKTASDLACVLGVADRTRFLMTDAFTVDWNEFDALYFYNPFEPALFDEHRQRPDRTLQIARVQLWMQRTHRNVLGVLS